jgi:hypothetical protein
MKPAKNARFWFWWNDGWVKLTLRPGQVLTINRFRRTDEGHTALTETFTHEGEMVRSEMTENSRDCDGPHEEWTVHRCRLDQLQDNNPENGIFAPLWQVISAQQRDHFAEAMGY